MTGRSDPGIAARLLGALVAGAALAPVLLATLGVLSSFSGPVRTLIGPAGVAVAGLAFIALSFDWPLRSVPRPVALVIRLLLILVALATLAILSAAPLNSLAERLGLAATLILAGWGLAVPLHLIRTTPAGDGAARLPWPGAIAAIAALVVGAAALNYHLTPPGMP